MLIIPTDGIFGKQLGRQISGTTNCINSMFPLGIPIQWGEQKKERSHIQSSHNTQEAFGKNMAYFSAACVLNIPTCSISSKSRVISRSLPMVRTQQIPNVHRHTSTNHFHTHLANCYASQWLACGRFTTNTLYVFDPSKSH